MPRFRPRFSLLTMLLVMTIAGMAIVIALMWREVGPLRAANRQMRTELGLLTIEDPKRAHAISLPTLEDNAWKWRIYLPPGRQYSLSLWSGHLPDRVGHRGKSWFEEVRKAGTGMSESGSNYGEFLLEARLIKDGNGWVLATQSIHRDGDNSSIGGGRTSVYQPSGDWLSDRRSRITSSDVAVSQKSFEPGEPILLLHLQRPVITETPGGGYTSQSPRGPADGVALWIEQRPAVAPAAANQ